MTPDDVLKRLHEIIDTKFNRSNRLKAVDPIVLKHKMTLWSLVDEFPEVTPFELMNMLKVLVERKSVETNLGNTGVHGFDSYFIPKLEL